MNRKTIVRCSFSGTLTIRKAIRTWIPHDSRLSMSGNWYVKSNRMSFQRGRDLMPLWRICCRNAPG